MIGMLTKLLVLFLASFGIVVGLLPLKIAAAFFVTYGILWIYGIVFKLEGDFAEALALMLFGFLVGFSIFVIRSILHFLQIRRNSYK